MKKYGSLQHIIIVAITFAGVSLAYDFFINDKVSLTGTLVKSIIFAPVFSLLMQKITSLSSKKHKDDKKLIRKN